MDQTLTDIIQECSWLKINCKDRISAMMMMMMMMMMMITTGIILIIHRFINWSKHCILP